MVFAVAVTAGILIYVMKQNPFQYLSEIKWPYLFGALVASLVGIWFDANRLVQMARLTGDRLSQNQSMKILFGNYFFAFFTPGATGGPIAQYLLLSRYGISAGKATLFIATRTLCSLTIMILLMPLLFHSGEGLPIDVPHYLPYLLSGLLLIFLFLAFRLARSPRFIRWSRGIVYMWSPQRFQRKLLRLHQDLSEVALLFSLNPFKMLFILIQTALSLSISYSMVYFLFIGFGISASPILVLGRMFLLNFLMHFAPTPGGSGIAEGLFILLFSSQSSAGIAGITALLWRLFAEYLPAIIGLLVMIQEFGYRYFKEKFWDVKEGGAP